MIRKTLLLALLFLSIPNLAFAKIIMDISKSTINISRNFRGTTITVFGVCDEDEDVIISVYGGSSHVKVKKMQKKHRLWTVDALIHFFEVPDIFSLYSTKKIENILSKSDISGLNLSITDLPIREDLNSRRDMLYLYDAFNAMISQRKKYNLLGEYVGGVEKVEASNLFKAQITIPDRIKAGNYNIVAYAIKDQKITSIVSTPLSIRKVGINGILYYLAYYYSGTYAILCVVWAMFLGWFMNYIIQAVHDKYRKDISRNSSYL